MDAVVIDIKNLHKTYAGFKAVDGLNFQVEQDECFGLLGPNGAGKTTTLKVIYGKARPDQDRDTVLNIFGRDPRRDPLTIKSRAGIVPQLDNLDTELNVRDNLLIYSKFYGIPQREADKRIAELLEFMELQDKAKAKTRELSGGMMRRLTIARALLNKPRLLILDEPTTGLDPQVRHVIWTKLRELQGMGVTILVTTHYMDEAFQLCDRLMIMDKGNKIVEGKPKELLKEYLEEYVMEIYAAGFERRTLTAVLEELAIKYEFHMDTLYAYSNNPEQLTRAGERLKGSDYYLRHSNLEDLFLKVTGRTLNELQ